MRLKQRSGRTAELRDLAWRAVRARALEADVFHAPHPGAWGPAPIPTAASILDVIPLDLGASYGKTGMKAKFLFGRAAGADSILTLSTFSGERIVDLLGVDEQRIVVAPLYPEPIFREAGNTWANTEARNPYVLTVLDMKTPDPRKRAAWIEPISKGLRRAGVETKVIGAGTDSRGAAIGHAQALGRISDEEMARWMSEAACFLYFSAYEGQGLPPLEAMASGAPVVAMGNTAVSEVVADAGVLIDERAGGWRSGLAEEIGNDRARQDELVSACVEFARDWSLRAEYSARSRLRAAAYSVERFQSGLDRAYGIAEARHG